MAFDAAALQGAPEDLASTIGTQAQNTESGGGPRDAVRGIVQQISRYNKNLDEMRQGAQSFQQQYPANGQTMQQIVGLTDQLQKLFATYMSDVVRQTAPAVEASSSLSGLLR